MFLCFVFNFDDVVVLIKNKKKYLSTTLRQFHVRIWHRALAVELGQVGGHFGPVNTISYSPDGRS